jgi:hypothetical protein
MISIHLKIWYDKNKLHEMSDGMKRISWIHVFVSLIVFLAFMIFVLPAESNKSTELGIEQSPDTSFFYTKEELYFIADSYGEEGRAFYVNQRFTFDLIWPIAYGLFLTMTLAYLGKNASSKWIRKAFYLPIGSVVIDYLENIMTATVMYRYPKETMIFSDLAGFVTALKWISLSLSFVILLVIGVIYVIHSLKKEKSL